MVLTSDHSERRVDDFAGDPRRLVAERKSHRLTQERVAGKDGNGLAEARVAAWLAAAQVVVVERRQIVVNQRKGMDELKRTRAREHVLNIDVKGLGGSQRQNGPDALAPTEQRVASGLAELSKLGRKCQIR